MGSIFNKDETNMHIEIARLLISSICKSKGIKKLDQNKYSDTFQNYFIFVHRFSLVNEFSINFKKNDNMFNNNENIVEICIYHNDNKSNKKIAYTLRYEGENKGWFDEYTDVKFSMLKIEIEDNIFSSLDNLKLFYDELAEKLKYYTKFCHIKDAINPKRSLLDIITKNLKTISKDKMQIKDNTIIIDDKLKVFEKLISVLPLNDFKKELLDINLKIETLFSSLLDVKDFDKNIINTYIKYKEEILGNYLNNYSILKLDENKNTFVEKETIEQLKDIFNSLEQIKEEKLNDAIENINTQKIFLSKKFKG